MNKIGICEWSLPIDGPYTCRLAAELGLDGVQLDIGAYERGFSKSRTAVQKAYLEYSRKWGIEFPSMAARVTDYFTMFPSRSETESAIVREGLQKAIGASADMGIPILLIPNFVHSEIRNEQDFKEAVECFKWACDLAGKSGLTIAAENTLPMDATLDLFKRIDRPNLKLYFDTQNYYLSKRLDTPTLLDGLMDYICQVHVKDGKNKDLSGALLGEGDTGFHRSMEVLKKHHYSGWIVLENYYDQKPLSAGNSDPAELIATDIKTLKAALQ